MDSVVSWGEEATNPPEPHNEVAEGQESDSWCSTTDSIGEIEGGHSDEGQPVESSANDTVQRQHQQHAAQSAPGNTIATEIAPPSGNREESPATHSV